MTLKMAEDIKGWIYEASALIKKRLDSPLIVEQKSCAADVVTNVDKEVEAFFVQKIQQFYPNEKILGEEGISKPVKDFSGRVWVIDPIDGTLNFVKQQDHFCIMLAVYENGIGRLGFIYEVMRDELLWGGDSIGVHINNRKITTVKKQSLAEGIINVNTNMFVANSFGTKDIARKALAVRMTGCAGIAFKEVILGKENGYLSYLQPWDYAPGKILAETLGLRVEGLDGRALDLKAQSPVLVAGSQTYKDIKNLVNP